MSGLLKWLSVAGAVGLLAWAGAGLLGRRDIHDRIESAVQATAVGPVGAMQNMGQAIRSSGAAAARSIDCAGGDRSGC